MSEILSRALSEFPRVSQSDILQLLDVCSHLTCKEHAKMFKSEAKALSSQKSGTRLDFDRCRLERVGVIPCKTTIETIKLTNPHKSTVQWKLQKPTQVTPQAFLSCSPTSGTLEKGKSVEIRVCCVLLTPKPFLDFLVFASSLSDNLNPSYLPIMLHIIPGDLPPPVPYWSVDYAELTFRASPGSAPLTVLRGSYSDTSSYPISASPSASTMSTGTQGGQNHSPTSNSPLGSQTLGGGSPSSLNRHSPLSRSESPINRSTHTHSPAIGNGHPFSSSFSSLPFPERTTSHNVVSSVADLYGTKVYVRRWMVDQFELPPQACLDEIEALRHLAHPNLVTFIGGRAEMGQAHVITKLIEGGTLETFLKCPKGDGKQLVRRLEMLLDIAYGMAFLHGKGIVHRHLSTSIMMVDDKHMRLMECGQSSNAPIPISCYMAPEVFSNSANASMESDVFSFGICLWETACATKPMRSGTDLANGTVPPLSCDTTMFPDLVELIYACCQKDPSKRPTFATIIYELQSIRDTALTRTSFRFVLTRNKTIKDRLISSFPSTLVFLDMSSNVHLTDTCIPELPRHLVHLDLQMCPNFTDEGIQFLPASLTHLDLSSATKLTNLAIPALPRALTFLSLRDNTNITEEGLEYFPADLTSLNLLNASKLTESCLPKFPQRLIELAMPCAWIPGFKDENVKLLPPALTTLSFQTNTTLTAAGLDQLPPSIKHINLAANSEISNSALSVLPRNLETLTITAAVNVTDEGLQFLPKTLLHLNLSRNKRIGHLGIRVLPANLLTLNLSATQNLLDISIRSIPRTLTALNLSGNKLLTDEAIKDLPPSLTELNFAANPNLTDACVRYFPASLKVLNLYWNTLFTDACIKMLPRSLTELNLSSNPNFTDTCIADLPRSLRVLYMRKSTNFTDSCIKYLPRSLTHLDIAAANLLTDDCISDMPTGLVTLEIWRNKNLSKENLRARLPSMRLLSLNVE